jgi:hypothetical protein
LLESRGVLEWYSVEGGPYSSPADAAAEFGGGSAIQRQTGGNETLAKGRAHVVRAA